MVIVVDEGFNLRFEIGRQEVVLEQNAVLQGLVPTLHCPAVDCAAINERGR